MTGWQLLTRKSLSSHITFLQDTQSRRTTTRCSIITSWEQTSELGAHRDNFVICNTGRNGIMLSEVSAIAYELHRKYQSEAVSMISNIAVTFTSGGIVSTVSCTQQLKQLFHLLVVHLFGIGSMSAYRNLTTRYRCLVHSFKSLSKASINRITYRSVAKRLIDQMTLVGGNRKSEK